MYLFKRQGYFHVEYFDEAENRTRRISTHATRKDEALKFLSDFKVFRIEQKNYVFHKHPGLRYERNFVSKQFKKAVRAAGLSEGLHFHSLRHSTASNMVRRGVPIAVVKEVLGHADIKTTMVYSHVRREDLANAVKMLDGEIESSNAL